MPSAPRRLLATALVAALALGGAACSKKEDGDDGAAKPAKTTTTTSAAAAAPTVALTVTGVDANGTKTPDDATVAAVKAALEGWVATALVAPLHTGQPAGDLSPYFTAAALERLNADPAVKATLVDEGLPPATKALTADKAEAKLYSVAGPDEVVAVVAAQLDLKLHSVGASHDVDVNHYGELVLVQDAPGGPWKIDSFDLHSPKDSRP
jgi:hypothetical protein